MEISKTKMENENTENQNSENEELIEKILKGEMTKPEPVQYIYTPENNLKKSEINKQEPENNTEQERNKQEAKYEETQKILSILNSYFELLNKNKLNCWDENDIIFFARISRMFIFYLDNDRFYKDNDIRLSDIRTLFLKDCIEAEEGERKDIWDNIKQNSEKDKRYYDCFKEVLLETADYLKGKEIEVNEINKIYHKYIEYRLEKTKYLSEIYKIVHGYKFKSTIKYSVQGALLRCVYKISSTNGYVIENEKPTSDISGILIIKSGDNEGHLKERYFYCPEEENKKVGKENNKDGVINPDTGKLIDKGKRTFKELLKKYDFDEKKQMFIVPAGTEKEKIKWNKVTFYSLFSDIESRNLLSKIDMIPSTTEKIYENQEGKLIFNTFRGLKLSRKNHYEPFNPPSSIYRILNHIALLCGIDINDSDLDKCPDLNNDTMKFILNYLSHIVIKPYEKTGKVLIFRSEREGTGKNIFFEWFGNEIIGRKYSYYGKGIEDISEKFNSLLENKIFCLLDEAREFSSRIDVDDIKRAATCTIINIEGKGKEKRDVSDYTNIVILTNNSWVISVKDSNRRIVMMNCIERYGDYMGQNKEYKNKYFDILRNQYFQNEKVKQDFFDFLYSRENILISMHDIRIPENSLIQEIRERSKTPLQSFVEQKISDIFNCEKVHKKDHIKVIVFATKSRDIYERYKLFVSNYFSNCKVMAINSFSEGFKKYFKKNNDKDKNNSYFNPERINNELSSHIIENDFQTEDEYIIEATNIKWERKSDYNN